jgi:hypothetical protein
MSFFFHLEAHHLEAKTSTQLLTCEPTINILANQTFDLRNFEFSPSSFDGHRPFSTSFLLSSILST